MPLDSEATNAAAYELFRARQEFLTIEHLPLSCQPTTVSEAYEIQTVLVKKLMAQSGGTKIGYKIGATNPAAKDMLGTKEPFSGVLISNYCHKTPLTINSKKFNVIVIEPEISLKLGSDLPKTNNPYTSETVIHSVQAAAPAIEIVTSPFPVWNKAGIVNIIADNGANGGWIHGEFIEPFHHLDLENQAVTLYVNGTNTREGFGKNVDGGPMAVLAWLANFMIDNGKMLTAGDIITTGSTTQPLVAGPRQELMADFGKLGNCCLVID